MSNSWNYHNLGGIYAQYLRSGIECGTHAAGIPDLDPVEPVVRYLLLRSMAGDLESGFGCRPADARNVSIFYPHGYNWLDVVGK